VGVTTDEGTLSVEPTLDGTGSLTTGVAEVVARTIDDGTPPVGATLDSTGSLSTGAAALEGGTTDEEIPPVDASISVADGTGIAIEVGIPPVEPTEGVEGSIGLGEGVGVRIGTGIPAVEPTMGTDDNDSLGTGSSGEAEGNVGRRGSEGTLCVEPISGVVRTGSEAESPGLVIGEGETTTVSALSEDEGRRCSSDSNMFEMSEDWSSGCVGVELGGRTRSDVGSGGVAGSVVFANCRLTCRGK
jgi:hypothetical protein